MDAFWSEADGASSNGARAGGRRIAAWQAAARRRWVERMVLRISLALNAVMLAAWMLYLNL